MINVRGGSWLDLVDSGNVRCGIGCGNVETYFGNDAPMRILAVQNAKRLRDGIGRIHEASVPRDVQLIHVCALDARAWVVRADERFREVADHTNAKLHLARASKRPATAPRGGRDPDHDVASGVELRHQHCVGDALQTLPGPTRLYQALPDLTIRYHTLPESVRAY